jgi:hypothetical protein
VPERPATRDSILHQHTVVMPICVIDIIFAL